MFGVIVVESGVGAVEECEVDEHPSQSFVRQRKKEKRQPGIMTQANMDSATCMDNYSSSSPLRNLWTLSLLPQQLEGRTL